MVHAITKHGPLFFSSGDESTDDGDGESRKGFPIEEDSLRTKASGRGIQGGTTFHTTRWTRQRFMAGQVGKGRLSRGHKRRNVDNVASDPFLASQLEEAVRGTRSTLKCHSKGRTLQLPNAITLSEKLSSRKPLRCTTGRTTLPNSRSG